ncbi:MAG TPA: phage holin family protein [Candidatus Thermoplasmatota archaeon]|nr:phage holin family protein [Candidatus Thermoplasmatota archaeon]
MTNDAPAQPPAAKAAPSTSSQAFPAVQPSLAPYEPSPSFPHAAGPSAPSASAFPTDPYSPRREPGRAGLAHAVAAIEGAVEGVTQGVDQHGLPQATHRAIDQLDRLSANARRGSAAPERPSALARRLHEATNSATRQVHKAQDAMEGVVADVKLKAHAVAETGRRAAAAPPVLARDVGQAAGAYAGGVARQAGWLSGAGMTGLFALVLLTVAAAAWLTTILGLAGATLVLGLLYGIGAFLCMGAAKAARKRADAKARTHLEAADAHLKHVGEPVRVAFQR